MLLKILVLLVIAGACVVGWKLLTADKPSPPARRGGSKGARAEPEAVEMIACSGCGAWKPAGAECQSCGHKGG